jgi:hypothetical protein
MATVPLPTRPLLGTQLQQLRQRIWMRTAGRPAHLPTAVHEVCFQLRFMHPSSEDGVTSLDLEVVAVTGADSHK